KSHAAQFHREHPFLADLLIGDIGNPNAGAAHSVTVKLPPARKPAAVRAPLQIGQFLEGGGGGAKKDHSADELQRKQLDALRQAYDYQRDDLNAQKDILEAKRDLASDYVEQTSLQIAMLNLERQMYK